MRPALALPVTRALLFDAGNTLLRMNYPAIAGHLGSRGHSAAPEAIEEAELRARVRLDADLARGTSTEGRAAQDSYLAYLLEGLGITDPAEVEAAAAFRQSYNAPAGLFDRAFPEAQSTIRRVKAAGLVRGSSSWRSVRPAWPRTRRPTWAISTRSTSWAPGPRACTRFSWTRAASGARATAQSRAILPR